MKILVTGAAGYIGSHFMLEVLKNTEHEIFALDNLSTGSQKAIDFLQKIRKFSFVRLDLKDFAGVEALLTQEKIDAIVHFAASIVVSESVADPLKYYMNNTANTINLVDKAVKAGVKNFIFSSTAAVYGEPRELPASGADENYPLLPINPYGASKMLSEAVIKDAASAHKDFKYVIFRYFNVAGANIAYDGGKLSPQIGQVCQNATHLIKVACECACGKREKMQIYGDDYATKDGTCIRDYIHVQDLAAAHLEAIEYLKHGESAVFNLGYQSGYSVKDVINAVKKVSGVDFQASVAPRRAGDAACLIANNEKILQHTNWKPKYNSLELICQSAYEWEKKQ
ncbi:MAG: UDP-glucose 4-epimerase GalE [Helicobacteraceae bacterium]